MTREKILAMEAGDELNAAIAKIMEDDLEHQWQEGPSQSGVKYCSRCNTYDWMPAAERPCSVKLYSEDISAAWQVIDKLIEDGFEPEASHHVFATPRSWLIKLRGNIPPFSEICQVYGKTVPEAICKAVLLAKLEK